MADMNINERSFLARITPEKLERMLDARIARGMKWVYYDESDHMINFADDTHFFSTDVSPEVREKLVAINKKNRTKIWNLMKASILAGWELI